MWKIRSPFKQTQEKSPNLIFAVDRSLLVDTVRTGFLKHLLSFLLLFHIFPWLRIV